MPAIVAVFDAVARWRAVALHSEQSGGKLVALLRGHLGGVSCVRFSPDGRSLWSGSRGARDQRLLGWDLRQLAQPLLSLTRRVATNQRMQFDLTPCVFHLPPLSSLLPAVRFPRPHRHDTSECASTAFDRACEAEAHMCTGDYWLVLHCTPLGALALVRSDSRYLLSGNHDGHVSVWDLDCATEPSLSWPAHDDCCNGLSCALTASRFRSSLCLSYSGVHSIECVNACARVHPSWPLVATASGQRAHESLAAFERRALARIATGSHKGAAALAYPHAPGASAAAACSPGCEEERCQACGQQMPAPSPSPSAEASAPSLSVHDVRVEQQAPPASEDEQSSADSSEEDSDSDTVHDIMHSTLFENSVKLWLFKHRLA